MLYRHFTAVLIIYALITFVVYLSHEHRLFDELTGGDKKHLNNTAKSGDRVNATYPVKEVMMLDEMQMFLLSTQKLKLLESLNTQLNERLSKTITKQQTRKICKKYGCSMFISFHFSK